MPILLCFLEPCPDLETRLRTAAALVADTLGLPADSVIAIHVPVGLTVRAGHDAPTWPLITVYGSPRDSEDMRAVVKALTDLLRTWSADGESWVTWQVPA